MQTSKLSITVALREETAGNAKGWVAQCLDYNLVAQGNSMEAAKLSFERVLRSHLILCEKRGEIPLLGARQTKTTTKAKLNASRLQAMTPKVRYNTLIPA